MKILRHLAQFIAFPFGFGLDFNQSTPMGHFCALTGHSAIKKGDGIFSFGGTRNATIYPNTTFDRQIFRVDVSQSWNILLGDNPTYIVDSANLSTGPPTDSMDTPIFSDAKGNYHVYTGGYASSNRSLGPNLWTMDNITGSWRSTSASMFPPEHSPREMPYVEAPELNLVFFLNGRLRNGSTNVVYPKMTILDTIMMTTRTVSTDQFMPYASRVGAALHYLPLMGRQGALVLFGGATKHDADLEGDHWSDMNSLDTIHVFDIASLNDTTDGIWYSQRTSGRIPPRRYVSCSMSILSPDQSNYHIYLNSGRSPTTIHDDIWVLSLPQFQWAQTFAGKRPNYGSTCHLVGNKQMMTLGGVDTVHTDAGDCRRGQYIALYDITNLKWMKTFKVDDGAFRVPKTVWEMFGGGPRGESRMRQPEGGFDDPGLAGMFDGMQTKLQVSEASGVLSSVVAWRGLWVLVVVAFMQY